jgi:hypothetical protein
VNEKDKVGLKREFKEKENEAWKSTVFNLDSEVFNLASVLLEYRDKQWPKEFHPQFGEVIRKAVEFADKTKEELSAAFDDPDDVS